MNHQRAILYLETVIEPMVAASKNSSNHERAEKHGSIVIVLVKRLTARLWTGEQKGFGRGRNRNHSG